LDRGRPGWWFVLLRMELVVWPPRCGPEPVRASTRRAGLGRV